MDYITGIDTMQYTPCPPKKQKQYSLGVMGNIFVGFYRTFHGLSGSERISNRFVVCFFWDTVYIFTLVDFISLDYLIYTRWQIINNLTSLYNTTSEDQFYIHDVTITE